MESSMWTCSFATEYSWCIHFIHLWGVRCSAFWMIKRHWVIGLVSITLYILAFGTRYIWVIALPSSWESKDERGSMSLKHEIILVEESHANTTQTMSSSTFSSNVGLLILRLPSPALSESQLRLSPHTTFRPPGGIFRVVSRRSWKLPSHVP